MTFNLENKFIDELLEINNIDVGLDYVSNYCDDLILSENYLLLDNIFTDIMEFDISLDENYLAALLVVSLHSKEDLYSREEFYEWVRTNLITFLGRKEALSILIGLK